MIKIVKYFGSPYIGEICYLGRTSSSVVACLSVKHEVPESNHGAADLEIAFHLTPRPLNADALCDLVMTCI